MTEILQNNLVKCFQYVETILQQSPPIPQSAQTLQVQQTLQSPHTPQTPQIPQQRQITQQNSQVQQQNPMTIVTNSSLPLNGLPSKSPSSHVPSTIPNPVKNVLNVKTPSTTPIKSIPSPIKTTEEIKDGFKYALEQDKELKRVAGSYYSTIVSGLTLKRHDWISELKQYGISIESNDDEMYEEMEQSDENDLEDFESLFGSKGEIQEVEMDENVETKVKMEMNNSFESLKTLLESLGCHIQVIKHQDPFRIILLESPSKELMIVLELNALLITKTQVLNGNFVKECKTFNDLYKLLRNKVHDVNNNLLQNPTSSV